MQAPARKLTPTSYFADVRPTALYVVPSQVSGNVTVSPAAASLVISPLTPSISAGGNISVVPAVASLVFSGATPTITVSDHKTVSPAAATLAFTGQTPTVTAQTTTTLSPAAAVLAFTGIAPTVSMTAAPTDISLSRQTVRVSAGLNATVGTISSTDPDAGDTFTYSLVSGIGSMDNAEFSISGNILMADDPAALGVGTRSVRIRTTDSQSNTYEKAFTITVLEASSNSFDFIQKTQFIGWMQ